MEASDADGFPLFTLPLAAALSPKATDEGLAAFFRTVEGCSPNFEAFEALLKGLPGFKMVHLFDKGFM